MEFQNPCEECSDYDKALSFCGLVTEQGIQEFALRDLNTGSLDQEGFVFDFDLGPCGSTTEHVFLAGDLFRYGFFEKPNWENLLACRNDSMDSQSTDWSTSSSSKRITDSGEMLRRSNSKSKRNLKPALTWRNDSLDSQSSFWSTSSSSQTKTHSGEIGRLRNSKSKGNCKPPASGGKMSIWRSLTVGLMKTPPMKLEDMRLRQAKAKKNINGAKNLDLRQSASCNYYKNPKLEEEDAKTVNLEEKCISVEELVVVEKTAWPKGWKALPRCPSFTSCMTSSNAVIDDGRLQKARSKSAGLR